MVLVQIQTFWGYWFRNRALVADCFDWGHTRSRRHKVGTLLGTTGFGAMLLLSVNNKSYPTRTNRNKRVSNDNVNVNDNDNVNVNESVYVNVNIDYNTLSLFI